MQESLSPTTGKRLKSVKFSEEVHVAKLCTPEDEDPRDKPYGWVVVLCAAFAFMLTDGLMISFSLQLSYIQEEFGISPSLAGSIGTVTSAVFCLMSAPSGLFVDLWTPQRALQLAALLCSLGFSLSILNKIGWVLFFTWSILFGTAGALTVNASITAASQYFEKFRPIAVALAVSSSGVGTLILSQVLTMLLESRGLKTTWAILIPIYFVVIFTAGCLMKPMESIEFGGKAEKFSFSSLFDLELLRYSKAYMYLVVVSTVVGFVWFTPFYLFVQYSEYLGETPGQQAILLSAIGIADAVARFTAPFLGRKTVNQRFYSYMFGFLSCGTACILFPISSFGFTARVVLACVYGAGFATFFSSEPVVVGDVVGIGRVSRGHGLYIAVGAPGSAAGLALADSLRIKFNSYWSPFIFLFIGFLVAIFFARISLHYLRKEDPHPGLVVQMEEIDGEPLHCEQEMNRNSDHEQSEGSISRMDEF